MNDVEHLFFLDYNSWPISPRANVQYRVLETRAVLVMRGLLRFTEIRYLVEEVTG